MTDLKKLAEEIRDISAELPSDCKDDPEFDYMHGQLKEIEALLLKVRDETIEETDNAVFKLCEAYRLRAHEITMRNIGTDSLETKIASGLHDYADVVSECLEIIRSLKSKESKE